MTASPIARVRAPFGERLPVVLQVVAAVAVGLAAAGIAAVFDPLIAVGLAGGIALVLLGLRWPLLPLFIFLALIPIEETASIAGAGTLSRWAGIVFAATYALPRLGRLVPGALPIAGWAYVAWATLSLAWAIDPASTGGQLQTLIQLALIGFLVADVVIHDPAAVRPLLWTYSISASVTAVLGVAAYLAGGASLVRGAAIAGQNPAQFATVLLPALIFGLHELIQGRHRLAAGLVSLVCAAAIVLSGTRSVWLAATIVVFFLMLPRLGPRKAIGALVAMAAIALVTLQVPGVGALVEERTMTATTTGGAGRTDIWSVGIEIIESSPVIGVGFANFPAAFTSALIRAADVTAGVGTGRGPHNVIIGTAGELGAVGLVLLALFITPLVLRRGWGPDGLVVQAVLASLMIDALFLDILGNRKQVWVAIGLAAGLAYLAKKARRGETVPGPPSGSGPCAGEAADRPGRPRSSGPAAGPAPGPTA